MSRSNIVKNYFRALEVISSLNCNLEHKSHVRRKQKMSDLEAIALTLIAEFRSINSENSLFKWINKDHLPNLIGRIQFNKRRRKLCFFFRI